MRILSFFSLLCLFLGLTACNDEEVQLIPEEVPPVENTLAFANADGTVTPYDFSYKTAVLDLNSSPTALDQFSQSFIATSVDVMDGGVLRGKADAIIFSILRATSGQVDDFRWEVDDQGSFIAYQGELFLVGLIVYDDLDFETGEFASAKQLDGGVVIMSIDPVTGKRKIYTDATVLSAAGKLMGEISGEFPVVTVPFFD